MNLIECNDFEDRLRAICDSAYLRGSAPDNPIRRLVEGTLSREEALAFWLSRWDNVLLLNTIILPRLLERCPDLKSRVELWRTIYPEYGLGSEEEAHPTLYRRFLLALGASPDRCELALDRDRPAIAAQLREIDQLSWLDLLGRFLGRETVGPKVFPLVQSALMHQFGLQTEALSFFAVHAGQDQHDADCLFKIAARHAVDDEKQQTLTRALEAYFEHEVAYCCALGPVTHTYRRAAAHSV